MAPESSATLAEGILAERDGEQVVSFQRRLARPIERVWAALTEPAELRGWLGEAQVDLVEGGRFDVRWLNTHDNGEATVRHATITRLVPPRLLETVGEPHGRLLWELQPVANGTLLSFSSTLALPAEYRASVLAGWHYHLDALAASLVGETTELVDLPNAVWQAHHDRYAARLV